MLTFFYHVLLCVSLALPPTLLQHWLLVLMAACLALAGVLLGFTSVTYKRSRLSPT